MSLWQTGKDIRKLRQIYGITQKELAGRLGVSVRVLSEWENGSWPDDDKLRKIANKLDEPDVLPMGGAVDDFITEYADAYEELREELRKEGI